MRFVRALIVGLLFVTAGDVSFAGQLVVVESTAPLLNPGQIVEASKPLSVPAGTYVILIGDDGKVRRLSGPFSGKPDLKQSKRGDTALMESISRFVGEKPPEDRSLGGIRGGEVPDPPDLWAINIARSARHCVPEGGGLVLWRPNPKRRLSLKVTDLTSGAKVAVTFRAETRTAPWPDELTPVDGGEYLMWEDGRSTAKRLVLHFVPADLPTDAHRVGRMADNGCMRQAHALLAQLVR